MSHLRKMKDEISALVSILKLGGRLIITFFEIFQIKCSYVVNSKKVGGRSPPCPPLTRALILIALFFKYQFHGKPNSKSLILDV